MAYIKVDHSEFQKAASEIDEYVTLLNKKMRQSQLEVETLSSNWQGKDFSQFKIQFSRTDNKDSTHYQMVEALKAYSKFLKYAGDKYKNAQIDAVNRANWLPKF